MNCISLYVKQIINHTLENMTAILNIEDKETEISNNMECYVVIKVIMKTIIQCGSMLWLEIKNSAVYISSFILVFLKKKLIINKR